MNIELKNVKPTYMSEEELSSSDIYMQNSVTFEQGRKYLIKAQSGHGKTSILNFIYGNNISFNGKINYDSNLPTFDLRVSELSYVFQDYKLFPALSVLENIELKNKLTNFKTAKEIDNLIEKMQLGHKRNNLVQKLSLGQRQRVAIIRALCQPFSFLLLDEPFSHLDNNNIEIIANIIRTELSDRNAGLIMTSLEDNTVFNFDTILNL